MTSYILHYNSVSHGAKATPPEPFKTRYFVGVEKISCATHGYHDKPSWDYEKDSATILDGDEGKNTKIWCEQCGYKDLHLSPLDEDAPKLKLEIVVPEIVA